MNLAKLARAGFLVPNGFFIPTSVYREYVTHNDLAPRIKHVAQDVDPTSPEALAAASDDIRSQFRTGVMLPDLVSALARGWRWLGAGPVAVRSSATVEDLPDLSFAGQQDTYLNVVGADALLEAVLSCWSSLWTARAIGYRVRNNIPHEGAALAVVVQELVGSFASGVLFTANPLNGLRSESVVDATLGLGEALVGGHVEPDHYIVDARNAEITYKSLGNKSMIIEGQAGGGVTSQVGPPSQIWAVPDQFILELVKTGIKIEALYGFPQDIEWAYLPSSSSLGEALEPGEDLYIIQSRPITSLFPIPDGMGPDPLQVLLSFGAVQGINGPMTPLGQDAIRFIFAGGASLFGFEVDHETQGVIKIAAERLWANMTAFIRHPIGARLAPRIFSAIEPGSLQALDEILACPQLGAGEGRLRFNTFWRISRFAVRMLKRILHFARLPEDKADQIRQQYQAEIARMQAESERLSGKDAPIVRIELFQKIFSGFVYVIPQIFTGAATGIIPLFVLSRLSNHLTGSGDLALVITRGLPYNVTTEMDLKLWDTARAIRTDEVARHLIEINSDIMLADLYLRDELPEIAQKAIANFLEEYGMRGPGEIDIGRPRWREQPAPIMGILRSYLQIEDESMAPDVVFKRGELAAEMAIGELATAARATFGGRVKARIVRAAARRVRALAGLRESPKFFIVQMMGIIRQSLLDWGRELVDVGRLDACDDLFFIYYNELEAFGRDDVRDWKKLVTDRRQKYVSEERRVQIPRLLQSDGRAFYAGITTSEGVENKLVGSPVSPGVVQGRVRVVLDPRHANLAPGEILVCPGTDPAWTPLFLAAGGLVLEVGGMMTHGAIVAREYGIPAVVGVDRATERLKTGMLIKVDGSSGVIEILSAQGRGVGNKV